MSSVAIPSGSVPRPGFFRVLWEVIVGYLLALFVLLLPIAGLAFVGVFDWHASGFRGWPLRGPYPPDGAWPISADVFCASVAIAVATLMIAGSLETMVKLPVSRPVVAGVVTITGVAPFLYAQLLPVSALVGLLVAAFLIRRFAIDRFERIPLRFSRWLLAAAAAAVAGLALTVGFGVTHPLWSTQAWADQDGHIHFQLHNAGLASVRVLGLSEPARIDHPLLPSLRRPRVEGALLDGHASRSIILLRRGCAPSDLRVRYRIFGRVRAVRLHPQPSNLHC